MKYKKNIINLLFLSLFSLSSYAYAQDPNPRIQLPNLKIGGGSNISPPIFKDKNTQSHKTKKNKHSIALEIIDLHEFNIFHEIPKAKNNFDVEFSNFDEITYGPYKISKRLYQKPWPDLTEVFKRIHAISRVLEKTSKNLDVRIQQAIHYADLLAIKAHITQKNSDIKSATEEYAKLYQKVPEKFQANIALNLGNILLLGDDTVSALPILKRILQAPSVGEEFYKNVNTSMIELYFLSGRYMKAWEILEGKIHSKTINKERYEYKLRIGDILFFLSRYQEASEWYQSILKPSDTKFIAQNLSWLYLANAVSHTGNQQVAKKIYLTMYPYFKNTLYGDIIEYYLSNSDAEKRKIAKKTSLKVIKDWVQVELLIDRYKKSPELFVGENFDNIIYDGDYNKGLIEKIRMLQAHTYEREQNYQKAIEIYQSMEITRSQNKFIRKKLRKAIVADLFEMGNSTTEEKDAYAFLKYLAKFDFYMRSQNPDKIYNLIFHNVKILGMSEIASEMTLHIIEKSIHDPKIQNSFYLKLAESMFDANAKFAYVHAIRLIDPNLLDFEDKEQFHKLKVNSFIKTNRRKEALEALKSWEDEGASAKNLYWIALKKIEIFENQKDYKVALQVVEDSIGSGKTELLPKSFDIYINPLMAQQIMLSNKIGKNYECLMSFYANQDRVLKTEYKTNALLAAISSALKMNKNKDVKKLMKVAKDHLKKETYEWLDEWTKGEMWINQLTNYLDKRETAHTDYENGTTP